MPIPRRSLTLTAPGQGELFAGRPKHEFFRYGQARDGRTPSPLPDRPEQIALPFESRPDLSRHVTSGVNRDVPIHRWYNFPHSYSHVLVHELLESWKIRPGDTVLDPFCGAGTTLVTARSLGISAIGVDRLPLAVLATNVKLSAPDPADVRRTWAELSHDPPDGSGETLPSDLPYLQRAFAASVLLQLLAWKRRIASVARRDEREFFSLALVGVSEEVSHLRKHGAFLRRIVRRGSAPVTPLLDARVRGMTDDLPEARDASGEPDRRWLAVEGDARALPLDDGSIAATITSPPYLNKHDYTRIFRPELELFFAESAAEVRRMRKIFLRSNVEAQVLFHDDAYAPPPLLARLLAHVRRTPATSERVVSVLEGYFEDMHLVLSEVFRVTRPGGRFALVIGSACYDGVLFPVDVLLAEVAVRAGWTLERIIVARERNNSPQQMGRFGRQASREGVVVLVKPPREGETAAS